MNRDNSVHMVSAKAVLGLMLGVNAVWFSLWRAKDAGLEDLTIRHRDLECIES